MTDEDWYKVLRRQPLGRLLHVPARRCEHMIERGTGRIINISSIIGQTGNIGQANYAASKSGLFGLTTTLAREAAFALKKAGKLDDNGVGLTVNTVAPGFIATEMLETVPEKVLDRHPRPDPAAGAWDARRRSRASCTSWPPTPRATSPARSGASTAGWTCDAGSCPFESSKGKWCNMTTPPITADDLERKLEELSAIERFEPPAEFRARARITDPEVYEDAARDPEAYWAEQAGDTALDAAVHERRSTTRTPRSSSGSPTASSTSPTTAWIATSRPGSATASPIHWRGEEGEERDITYADLHRDVQRLANALKDLGVGKGDVVGIFLPMIPEVVVAMLACARIGAPHNVVFGGFAPESVRERMEVSHAKALITVDGARRKGRTAPIKAEVDEVMGGLRVARDDRRRAAHRHRRADARRPGRLVYDELLGAAATVCPAEPLDAEHPLFILYSSGSTAKPKGIVHTTGGYLTGRRDHPPGRVRPPARVRRVLVHGRRRLGHRALLHRLRAARERLHERDVRGRAGLPAQGRSGGR